MDVRLERARRKDMGTVKRLYRRAFPAEERPPFWLLRRRAAQGKGELLTAWDGEDFVGLVSLLCKGDLVYLFYFAIAEGLRGQGYGTAILAQVLERCRGKRLFLARESLDPAADNYDQRVRRHTFYLRCGFSDWNAQIKEGGVTYDVMGVGEPIGSWEYSDLMTDWAGWLSRFVEMRLWTTDGPGEPGKPEGEARKPDGKPEEDGRETAEKRTETEGEP